MSRSGMGRTALLAALIMSAAGGLGKGLYEAPERQDPEGWKRKKWQKGPSAGPGGPKVKLRVPKRRTP